MLSFPLLWLWTINQHSWSHAAGCFTTWKINSAFNFYLLLNIIFMLLDRVVPCRVLQQTVLQKWKWTNTSYNCSKFEISFSCDIQGSMTLHCAFLCSESFQSDQCSKLTPYKHSALSHSKRSCVIGAVTHWNRNDRYAKNGFRGEWNTHCSLFTSEWNVFLPSHEQT